MSTFALSVIIGFLVGKLIYALLSWRARRWELTEEHIRRRT